MTARPVPEPRVWHLPLSGRHSDARFRRILLGRQGLFRKDRSLVGYELLFRAPGRLGLRIDLWNPRQQDRATEHVLAAAFFTGPDLSGGLPLFVNFTRSYLMDLDRYLHDPGDIVIEVVESAHADQALYDRLAALKLQGYKIAIDDFIGTRSQRELLSLADFVKIDYRDFSARGDSLVEAARAPHATLVAERIESLTALRRCEDVGFSLFQGHCFEPALVIERARVEVDAV